ncbi:pentapeptide repeat-containing protein [Mesobaculum littorinae]|uniref:Pentapeptide repeat-containing protein n=1 Tax=Mesobaculum littorinae TaxID=2486419 RepID=A0A438AJ91_9RHOB|nr:pentapeptide repeat-containing protein [Mesobaculum littorinae]RVV98780.1 pentapeptide repeat-containing protein [Mesobaculum littorinae]
MRISWPEVPDAPGILATLFLINVLFVMIYLATKGVGASPRRLEERYLAALGWFAALLSPVWVSLLVLAIWQLILLAEHPPQLDQGEALRWHVLAIVGSTTMLVGLVSAPLALIRVVTTERQTKATEEGLITDRINKAVANLGANKEVNRLGRTVRFKLQGDSATEFEWMDTPVDLPTIDPGTLEEESWTQIAQTVPNLVVRVGAIYALERISQDSERDHIQVMEILCAYIRQNAPASKAQDSPHAVFKRLTKNTEYGEGLHPEDAFRHQTYRGANRGFGWNPTELDTANLHIWADSLSPAPIDIQTAISVIGRRAPDRLKFEARNGYRIDLQGTNLQGADMQQANLKDARMQGSRLEGTNLLEARLDGADLERVRLDVSMLPKAHFTLSNLEQASLRGAVLTSAVLNEADLTGSTWKDAYAHDVHMEGIEFSPSTIARTLPKVGEFSPATLRGAGLREIDLSAYLLGSNILGSTFGDRSVTLHPDDVRPDHWENDAELNEGEFRTRWRAFQRSIEY